MSCTIRQLPVIGFESGTFLRHEVVLDNDSVFFFCLISRETGRDSLENA
jgi:hypothetical protein